MKKLITLIIVLLSFVSQMNAQEKIIFSFKDRTVPTPPNNLAKGDMYQIVITDINLNLYKVSVNNSDTTLTKELKMPTFASFELDAISSLIAGIAPQTATFEYVHRKGSLKHSVVDTLVIPSPIGIKMEEYKILLEGYTNNLQLIKKRLDDIQFEVIRYSTNQLQEEPLTLPTTYNYDAALKQIIELRNEITVIQGKITASQKAYLKFSEDNKQDIADNENHKATDIELKASFTKLLAACTEAQTAVSADKVKELLAVIVHTQNNSSRTYSSLPIQFAKEQAKVDITIEPRKPEYMLQTYKTSITFPANKLSYAGVGISFYGSSLYDEKYSFEGIAVNDSVTHYKARKEDVTKAEIGMAALLRFGKKFEKNDLWGFHGSIGPGISISDKVKPRVLAGIGASAGRNHMFTVDAGAIFGYVERLSSTYQQLDAELTVKPESVTVSKLKAGGFVTIGYLYKF